MSPVKDPIPREFRQQMEKAYSTVPQGDLERVLDNLVYLIEFGKDRRQSLRSFLEQVARTIFKLFDFEEVSIGLKDKKEDKWRYEVIFGYTKQVESNLRKIEYDRDDMFGSSKYPNIQIGRLSELIVVEGIPDEESNFYNRPFKVGAKRQSMDEFHEGDFMDFWIYGPNKEIISWIELSRPRTGKMPQRSTVRWVELIAGACSSIIRNKWIEEQRKGATH